MSDQLEFSILKKAARNSGKIVPAKYAYAGVAEASMTVDDVLYPDPDNDVETLRGFVITLEPGRYRWHPADGEWKNWSVIENPNKDDISYIVPKWRDDTDQPNSTIHQIQLADAAMAAPPFNATDSSA